jgi:hypothetical protein
MFNEYFPILSAGYSRNIAQYCPQAVQWIFSNTVHKLFKEYFSILSTGSSMNIFQYCPQAVQGIFHNTVHRLFNKYFPILSTGCSMNIFQHCSQAVQWILPNTVHTLLFSYCPKLSNAYSAVLNRGYWVFSRFQIKSKFILCVRYTVQTFHIKLTVINIVQYLLLIVCGCF